MEEYSLQGAFCMVWSAVAGEGLVWLLHTGYPELPGYISPGLHGTGTAAAGNPAAASVPHTDYLPDNPDGIWENPRFPSHAIPGATGWLVN